MATLRQPARTDQTHTTRFLRTSKTITPHTPSIAAPGSGTATAYQAHPSQWQITGLAHAFR